MSYWPIYAFPGLANDVLVPYAVWHNLNHYVILNTNTITGYQNPVMGLVFKLTLWIQHNRILKSCYEVSIQTDIIVTIT